MKYKKVGNKLFLVKDNGEVTQIEVTQEQVDAQKLEEVKETPKDEAPKDEDLAKAENELKEFVVSTVKGKISDVVKDIQGIKSLDKDIKQSLADAFKSEAPKNHFSADEDGKKSVTAEDVMKGLKSVKGSGVGSTYTFSADSEKALSELNSLTGNVILEDRKTDIVRENVRPIFLEQIVNVSATGSDKISYVECTDETGTPLTTAEMAKFPEKDFEFNTFQAPVKKISVMHKASNEILEDAPQLVSKVREWLNEDMNVEAENKMLFGTGASGEFTGIFAIAPTFAAGNFTNTVLKANEFDVLRVAIQQIVNASKSRYMPNAILMNPEDVAKMDLVKNSQESYVLPPFITADKTTVRGVRIIENPAIPAGEFLVGDFNKANLANRRGLSMQVATENVDDFEKDMISIRLSRRFAFYVRNNDIGAFVKGVFATAITALDNA